MRTSQKTNAVVKWKVPTKAQIGKQTSGGCSIKPPLERSSSKLVHITAILLSNVHQLKCSSLKYMNCPPTCHPSFWPTKLGLYKMTSQFADCCYCTALAVVVIYSYSVMQLWSIYTFCLCLSSWCCPKPNYYGYKAHHYLSTVFVNTRKKENNISCCTGLGMVCEDVVDWLL